MLLAVTNYIVNWEKQVTINITSVSFLTNKTKLFEKIVLLSTKIIFKRNSIKEKRESKVCRYLKYLIF